MIKHKAILFLFLLCQQTASAFDFMPIELSPYMGFAAFSNAQTRVGMLQTGFKFTPVKTPLFIALDNNLHVRSKAYEWQDIGNYRYRRTINNTGLSAGFNLFRKTPFCLMFGFRADASIYKGRVSRGSDAAEESIPSYRTLQYTISPFFYASYRINEAFSVYMNYHFMAENRTEVNHVTAFGLAYNIYSATP